MQETKLYLLPNSLDPNNFDKNLFPANLGSIVSDLNGIFVEDEKIARKYLLQFMDRDEMQKIQMEKLSKYTDENELKEFISIIRKGGKFGILSDAGLPCIADPGSKLVELAKKNSIQVKSVTGPSSILIALMLSGFSAQSFVFHGYLPRKIDMLAKKLAIMEKSASLELFTHVWIEAPYRSDKMLQSCIEILNPKTLLCAAISLTSKDERVITQPISTWKQKKIEIGKNPCVFLLAVKPQKK